MKRRKAAGESFMANLQRGYTTNQITSASFGQTSQASDQKSAGQANSIGTSMQSDSQILDYFTQKSGLPPLQAARALTDLRGSDPAAFATIANEARAAYAASPQGQAALGNRRRHRAGQSGPGVGSRAGGCRTESA